MNTVKTDETRINVRITLDEQRMLAEMLHTWHPGKVRMQGAIVGQAIRLLYAKFAREQALAEREAERKVEWEPQRG